VEKLALAMDLARRTWDRLDLIADDDGLETDLCTASLPGHDSPIIRVGLQVVTPKA
jgi:hypothetical protein